MKTIIAATFILGLAVSSAFGQTESPPPEAAPSASVAAKRAANQELIAKCRAEAKTQGVKGPAMRDAIKTCVAKENPGLAKRMECQQQARGQGITDKDQIRSFVRTCLSHEK